MKTPTVSVASGVSLVSAFFSVLPLSCCAFPVALSILGAFGVGFAMALTPYRPYFLALTVASLAAAFYFTYRPHRDCLPGTACPKPRRRKVQLVSLRIVIALVLVLMAFPYLVPYLPV